MMASQLCWFSTNAMLKTTLFRELKELSENIVTGPVE